MSRRKRCTAAVYKRDTYRVSRGHGFKMHYTKCQCERGVLPEGVLCRQHQKMADEGQNLERVNWHEYVS